MVKAVVDLAGADGAKDRTAQAPAAIAAMDHIVQAVGGAGSDWVRTLLPMNQFLDVKRDGFVGRKELFDAVNASKAALTVISAGPGAGKSSFLAQFHYTQPEQVVAVHVCRFGMVDTLDARRWVDSIG